jgi:predicted NUDIX family NTP pyrophosphohydrolase
VRQVGGKVVHAWAVKGAFDPSMLKSNTFSMEWPPRSGRQQRFPEIDCAAWFPMPLALRKILPGQVPLLVELAEHLAARWG